MSKIYIFNTLGREKQEFEPLREGKVSFYHCGPTVYWTQHIGNLRGMTCADFIVRTLRYFDYEVTHVRNYTDVGHLTSDEDEGEDKIEKGAKREGKTPREIANKYIDIFELDVAELNLSEPDHKPRATEHVEEMIAMVKTLLDKGYAYTTNLAVYFDISKKDDYTELSGQDLEKLLSGAGKGEIADPEKKNPADFALWFFKTGAHQNALQTWKSPFQSKLVENGEGFPGWHLECSAMSKKYLGDTVDIHMGGIEHIPVHHTNEIAQSECANGVKFVNYWLHNEHLLEKEKKIAKSEGASLTLSVIKDQGYDPLDLRFFFLQAQYRSKQNFTWEALDAARRGREHLNNQVRELGSEKGEINREFKEKFKAALGDDFNTCSALSVVQELLKSDLAEKDKLATVLDFDQVLGLKLDEDNLSSETPEEINKLIKEREVARQKKDFAKADRLREEIEQRGYVVEDAKDGVRVFKK